MFVASVIHHAIRMRLIASSGVAYLVLPHLPHYLIKGAIFLKKVTEGKIYVFIFSTTFSERFPLPRRIQLDIIINVPRSSCKIPFILLRF
jgi:hypothetical protein